MTSPVDSGAAGRLLVVTSTWPLHAQDARTPFVRNLAQDLAARGWAVEVLAPHAPGAADRTQDGAIAVRRFRYMWPERWEVLAYGAGGLINMRAPGRKLLALPFVVAEILAVRAALRRSKPDIVHAHWLLPQGFAAAIAVAGAKVPLVTTIHGGDVFGLRSAIFRPFKRLAVRRADAVTVNGTATLSSAIALGADPGRTQTIRFAPGFEGEVTQTDVSGWRSRYPADGTIVLFVGRLVPEKGAADFIAALARAANKKLFGVICGDGPMRSELQALVRDHGLQERVAFEGWLQPDEVACRMAGADVLLFPSKKSPEGWVEAQGVVLVEAMRRGLPILAARSGGIPDLIEDGRTGWLFPEGDVDAMAGLLQSFAGKSAAEIARVVEAARDIALNEINRERTAAAFHDLFTRLATERRDQERLGEVVS